MTPPGINSKSNDVEKLDAVIVGAGFSGLYQLHLLREKLGKKVKGLEAASEVGGTWYWNRYPGARCDSESHTYCYYFTDELLKEWQWSERYPGQEEILRYLNFCADRLDLRRSIYFNERVCSAVWHDQQNQWRVKTENGRTIDAKYLITAVGCLSSTNIPNFENFNSFNGDFYHTGEWPQGGVDFSDKVVAIIGTGSTGIQAIPVIAKTAKKLTVLQRTPNYSVPARNAPLPQNHHVQFCNELDIWRSKMSVSRHGHPWTAPPKKLCETSKKERNEILETGWQVGGLRFRESFDDILTDEKSNRIMSDFIRKKIKETVNDAVVAKTLLPHDHPFGTKRPPIDTEYFETFNRENVTLVDIKKNPIKNLNSDGITLESGDKIQADIIVFATGFDAMTGSLLKLGIVGRNNLTLAEAWQNGPRTFLGLSTNGFPNLFMITGPGSPSVLTNMPRAIEQHAEWITNCMKHCDEVGARTIEAENTAMLNWTDHVTAVANQTLLPKANHSWYFGGNIPGKPRTFMPYSAGLDKFRSNCEQIAKSGYIGFKITQ